MKTLTHSNLYSVKHILCRKRNFLRANILSQWRCGGWKKFVFTRHKFLLVTVKELLKSVLNYRSYPKNKTGYPFFVPHCICFFMNQIALSKETMFTGLVVLLSTSKRLKNVRENVLWIRHVLLSTGSQATWGNPVGFWRHRMWDLQRNLELLLTTCSWTELAWVRL